LHIIHYRILVLTKRANYIDFLK